MSTPRWAVLASASMGVCVGLWGSAGCGPSLSDWIELDRKILKKRVWPTKRVVDREVKHRLTVEEDRPTRLRIRLWEERICAARILSERDYALSFSRAKSCPASPKRCCLRRRASLP